MLIIKDSENCIIKRQIWIKILTNLFFLFKQLHNVIAFIIRDLKRDLMGPFIRKLTQFANKRFPFTLNLWAMHIFFSLG